jgi:nucleoid-associated protein YgaU
MALQTDYADVLETAKSAGVNLTEVKEDGGKLVLTGTAQYGYQRDQMWDRIKTHANWQNEVAVMLNVTDSSIYGNYKVQAGETLGKIAKHFLGDAGQYKRIFELNKDQLKDADHIQVGQTLKIPNKASAPTV